MPPSLSVVVIVHRRHEYLPHALESALQQTLARDQYEILLVGTEIEARLVEPYRDAGVRIHATGSPELGTKVAEGLQLARGGVVCLLEDDDRFLPNKLEEVRKRFDHDPNLVFYHNNFITIGPDEAPWNGTFHRSGARARVERRHRIYRPAGMIGGWGSFRGTFPGFNNSCVALRREAFLPHLRPIGRSGLVTDETLFFVAAATGGALLQDDAALTRLMVHPSSISNPVVGARGVDVEALIRYSALTEGPRRTFLEAVEGSGRRDLVELADAEIAVQELVAGLRNSDAGVRTFIGPLRRVIARPGTLAFQNFPRVTLLAMVAVPFPRLAHRLYRLLKSWGA